ncbi:hypothetical protein EW093_04675 [Thiospirochaeta perfilievii]|uniref:PrsW family intramembrane metalloprotease n=1 Tax=Thiospirochaeta perfilievii TaxID=252967 RepID=A0A5C1QBI3_9SPIO|nr:hypothetical protein [Thiospirochaeta perfilievii]QEN04024.1 hypothetical protein EW093_04675 [Thiospirochaeta perfilievii]
MILEIVKTLLPSILVLILLYSVIQITIGVDRVLVYKALILGILAVLPALIFMKILGLIIIITIPINLPFLFFKLLSAINEEGFKYIAIKQFKDIPNRPVISLFVGGGFSLCETLYLTIENYNYSLIRSFTALPLHIITALLLSKSLSRKRYFVLSLFIHLFYNLTLFKIYN